MPLVGTPEEADGAAEKDLEMIRGLGHGVVIVGMIVTAQPLVAEVAEDQERGSDNRDATLSRDFQNVVSEDCGQEDESKAGDPECHNAPVSVSPTSKRQGNEACGEDEPQQHGVKTDVPQEGRGEERKGDDDDRDQKAVHGAHCRDQYSYLVAKGLSVLKHRAS